MKAKILRRYSRRFSIKLIIAFILIPVLLFPGSSSAARPANGSHLRFKRFSFEQGLSQSRIAAILQDRQGYLWLGTRRGLVKYDGYTFRTYEHEPDNTDSISADHINCLIEDEKGILWIGTNNGLNLLDPGQETFTCHKPSPTGNSFENNETWSIYRGPSGTWVGTSQGLHKFSPGTKTFTCYRWNPREKYNRVFTIHGDRGGMLWIGTSYGLYKFDPKTKTFSRCRQVPGVIWAIDEGRDSVLWIGSSRGLIRYNPVTGALKRYVHDEKNPDTLTSNLVNVILRDSKGKFWLGTDRGLNRFDPETETVTRFLHDPQKTYSLSSNLILSVYEDRSGVTWIGTLEKGLNKLEPNSEVFAHYAHDPQNPASLSSSLVSSIYEDQSGILWIGTIDRGLNKFDPDRKKFEHILFDTDENPITLKNAVNAICGDHTGRPATAAGSTGILWVGTYGGGLFAFHPKNKTYRNYVHEPQNPGSLSSNVISSIYCDRRGVTWIGTTAEGLNRFDSHNHTFTRLTHNPDRKDSLSHNSINTIYGDRFGFLWVGTDNGLDKLDPRSGKCERFSPFKSGQKPGDYAVTAIDEDRSGILWTGTKSGLFKYNPVTGQFKRYTKKEGLPANYICGLLTDETGSLWIGTTNGLSKFDPRTGEFKNYDFRDGLQHNDFSAGFAYKCRSGRLCFGGTNGFSMFFPEDIKDNPYPPTIAITSFKKFNKKVKLRKKISEYEKIKLSYKDYFFSFEFTALDFRAPEKNRYAYKMKNFDKEWITTDAGNRVAPYTNLPPGDYVFRVKGSNNSGLWNEDGASVRVVIEPPFTKTWWFTLLAIIAFALISYLIIHFFRKYFTLITFWKKKVFIGHYKIVDEIGSGGMGTVYKAEHVMDTSKSAAVKVIRNEFSQDSGRRKRFLMEAAMIDRIDHPNIVKIIERGEHNNRLFIAMEHLEGQTLRDRMTKTGKMPLEDAGKIMEQLLSVISAIHQKGIVHRDLKPENVMLTVEGTNKNFVKLLDFGLAKTEGLTQLTETGTILGTIGYIPAEHIAGEKYTAACDVYALGIIFYEMITGEKPFIGETTLDVMKQILEKTPVEPQVFRKQIPVELNYLIMAMIAKDPGTRPTAADTLNALKTMEFAGKYNK